MDLRVTLHLVAPSERNVSEYHLIGWCWRSPVAVLGCSVCSLTLNSGAFWRFGGTSEWPLIRKWLVNTPPRSPQWWAGSLEFRWQLLQVSELRDAHRRCRVAKRIRYDQLLLALAKNEADTRIVARVLDIPPLNRNPPAREGVGAYPQNFQFSPTMGNSPSCVSMVCLLFARLQLRKAKFCRFVAFCKPTNSTTGFSRKLKVRSTRKSNRK